MIHSVRNWAIIIVTGLIVIAIWVFLAIKVFQLFFDEDYRLATRQAPFKELQVPDLSRESLVPDITIDNDAIAKIAQQSVHNIRYLTDQLNSGAISDNDTFVETLYLMNIEDDTEKNRYVVALQWPQEFSHDITTEVEDTVLLVTGYVAPDDMDNEPIEKISRPARIQGSVELPGPGLDAGVTSFYEDGTLMIFVPRQ